MIFIITIICSYENSINNLLCYFFSHVWNFRSSVLCRIRCHWICWMLWESWKRSWNVRAMNHWNYFLLLWTEDLRYHQSTEYLKASELKEVKNKNEKTLSKLKLILDDLFEVLSESFHLERTSYDQQVEKVLSEIQSHLKYIDYSESF